MAAVLVVAGASAAAIQEVVPVVRARYHRVTFENDVVRVVQVEIPSGSATDYHEHTQDSVTVVLTPASVTLQPLGGAVAAATFASGDALFTPAPTPYTHQVGNAGGESLRLTTIELMRPASATSRAVPAGNEPANVLLENGRVQVRRVSLDPGESSASVSGPLIRVFVTGGIATNDRQRMTVTSGLTRWTPSGERSTIVNTGDARLTFVDVLLR